MNIPDFTKLQTELNKKTLRRIILSVFIAFFILVLLFDVAFKIIGIRNKRIKDIDDVAYTDVYFSDGRSMTVQSASFPLIRYGDKAVVHIPISKIDARSDDQICFVFYNSLVRVYANNHTVYNNGDHYNNGGHMVGNVLCRIPITTAALKKSQDILIEIRPQKYASISKLIHLRVMPAEEASLYPLVDHEVDFMLFITILVFSSFVLGLMIIFMPFGMHTPKGIALAAFCVTVSCWFLGYNDMFYIISDNALICSRIEYPALYFAPIPLFIYFFMNAPDKITKRLYLFFTAASVLIFTVTTLLHLFAAEWNYNRTIPLIHVFIAISVAVLLFVYLRTRKSRTGISDQIMTIGVSLFCVLVMMQIIEINVFHTNHAELTRINSSYSTLAILVFVTSLILNSALKYFESQQIMFAKHQLEIAAYVDALTGIPSRSACYKELQALTNSNRKDFSILFIDANNLKHANDQYGHEMGDKLICFISNCLRNAFQGEGFYGRWGGDEFLVCIHDPSDADKFLKEFLELIKKDGGTFAFPVTVAYGRADSTTELPLTPEAAVNVADAIMYQHKRKTKSSMPPPEDRST
ncbi:diguanylate cyclase (GGDEF) domain-containing protein [Lachnospiraceae bacterium]|nr:diguanylate cyclase (GGDEF) domain-containing protein [Lachnospiraceae bacterium]